MFSFLVRQRDGLGDYFDNLNAALCNPEFDVRWGVWRGRRDRPWVNRSYIIEGFVLNNMRVPKYYYFVSPKSMGKMKKAVSEETDFDVVFFLFLRVLSLEFFFFNVNEFLAISFFRHQLIANSIV